MLDDAQGERAADAGQFGQFGDRGAIYVDDVLDALRRQLVVVDEAACGAAVPQPPHADADDRSEDRRGDDRLICAAGERAFSETGAEVGRRFRHSRNRPADVGRSASGLTVCGFQPSISRMGRKEYRQIEWDAALEDDLRQLIRLAVREDLAGHHDWTTFLLVDDAATAR